MGRVGELLVILAIVFLLFGTRRLKDFGSDLGAAIKGFKSQVGDGKQLQHEPAVSTAHSFSADSTLQSEPVKKTHA